MTGLWQRLKQRKLAQWAAAYLAATWVLLQVIDLASDSYDWPKLVMHSAFGLLALGFVVTLVLAWYHGERGAQRVSGMELLIVALVLVVGGGVLWNFSRNGSTTTVTSSVAHTGSPDAAQRLRLQEMQTRTAKPARRVSDRDVANQPGTDNPPDAAAAASSGLRVASAPIPAQPIPAKSVAVLPFENLSTSKDNAYFADGMQDLILTKLADIGDLKVISRTSTMKYASRPDDLKIIGQQLGVATILEGSVQKAGNQVLINVQLIDAKTDSHIWAQDYTRTLDNIFGVEGEVADKVAKALNAKLTASERAAIARIPTHDKQAYDAYLKGIYYLYDAQDNERPSEFEQAVGFLQESVRHDPMFADAFSALAAAYRHMGGHHNQAESAIRRALALNPNSTYARIQLARLLDQGGQFTEALKQAELALRQAPDNAGATNGLGNIYSDLGRYDDAIATYKHAIELSSNNRMVTVAQLNMAQALEAQRRYSDARDATSDVLAHNPAMVGAAVMLASVYEAGWGDLASANKALHEVPATVSSSGSLCDAWFWLDLYGHDYAAALAAIGQAPTSWFAYNRFPLGLYQGVAYQAQGDDARAKVAYAAARVQLRNWIKASPDDATLHANLALVLAGLGERDAALNEAQRAMALKPIEKFPYDGIGPMTAMAQVQARVGDRASALKLLSRLLSMPTGIDVSVALLKLDPVWDPIRHDPRFQALLKKYGKDEQAPSATSAGSAPNA